MLGHASRAYTMGETLEKHFFSNRKIEKSLISFLVDGADFNKPTQKVNECVNRVFRISPLPHYFVEVKAIIWWNEKGKTKLLSYGH